MSATPPADHPTDIDAPCERLAWDSDFFGFPIAKVRGEWLDDALAQRIETWSKAHDVACLYFAASADDAGTVLAAEAHGYHLVDIRLTFARTARERASGGALTIATAETGVRPARAEDLPVLERIAAESHHDTRFYFDPHFPRALCDALYARWIRASFEGFAQAVWVAEQDGRAVGYVTCHIDATPPMGRIGLIAIDGSARGAGWGRKLVDHAVTWLEQQGLRQITVVTQARNVGAQRLYQKAGFVTSQIHLFYHKWFKDPGSGTLDIR